MLECDKTGDRSGAAWQAVLKPFTNLEMVLSDAAKGIAAGVRDVAAARVAAAEAKAAEAKAVAVDPSTPETTAVPLEHGLDVFHTNQEARRVLAGPWRRAEAAWEEAEAADGRAEVEKQQGRDARGVCQKAWRAWDKAEALFREVDGVESAWQRARAALAVFRPDGTLNDRAWAESEIEAALAALRGPEWKKLRNVLRDARSLTFLDRLHRRLREAEPNATLRRMAVRRWWLRHQAPRSTPSPQPAQTPPSPVQATVQALLDAKVREGELTAEEQAVYDRVAAVLRTTIRASSAVEGINSVLRMQQGRHRKMTQGLLDLKRLYWNCRPLHTGKRRGRCPYEMLGASLPSTDFWTLMRGTGKPRSAPSPEEVSSMEVGA
jgi:hypothetical protein